jgi:predicted oxidoreductase
MISKVKLNSKLELSELVYGVWRLTADKKNLDPNYLLKKIEICIDKGLTSFDHADIYGNYSCEEVFGNAIKLKPEIKSKIQIITKADIMLLSSSQPNTHVKHYDTSRDHLFQSVDSSLKKLQVEKIDLFLLHRPDPLMNASEVAETLDQLVESGKVLNIGVSNFTCSQFSMLNSKLKNKLVTNQIEFSIGELKALYDGTLDQAQEVNFKPMAWSPTNGGKIFTSTDEKYIRIRRKLSELHRKYNSSIEALCFAFILAHPSQMIPIIGSNDMDRILSILKSIEIKLERQDWFDILTISENKEVP